jgi:hypothetical protein
MPDNPLRVPLTNHEEDPSRIDFDPSSGARTYGVYYSLVTAVAIVYSLLAIIILWFLPWWLIVAGVLISFLRADGGFASFRRRQGQLRLHKAPGSLVLRFADFFCSPKTVDQVFEPLVADWQDEYFLALSEHRTLKAKWISMRYLWSAVCALGLTRLFSLIKSISPVGK